MNSMKKITLDKEKETLLIPLYGKALESRKSSPVLHDPTAVEIIEKINYDFASLKIPGKTNFMMCLRAKLFDNFTLDFLASHSHTVVIHLGCGLDSRYKRINNSSVNWYDIDFEEVINIRKLFYQQTGSYHMIGSSVTRQEWFEEIPVGAENYLVIAEGLFMYLKKEEIKALLKSLKKKIGSYKLIFDAYSTYTAKKVMNHPSLKKTGAIIRWGLDHPHTLSEWNPGILFIDQILFTSNEELGKLNRSTRLIYRFAHLFPMARNAQRILIYDV